MAKKPDTEDETKPVKVAISEHPRAKAGIRRARTRSALIAFILVLALNMAGDQTLFDSVWRALLAGIAVNLIVWRCAIVVWRHILQSELEELREAREQRRREHEERMERLRAEREAAEQEEQANAGT
jgi:type VI protein secretion system component VasK